MGKGVIRLDSVVRDIKSKVDYLMSVYFMSHSKQNAHNPELVLSLPKRMAEFKSTPGDMAANIELDVNRLLSDYFDNVSVDANVKVLGDDYNITLDVNIIEGGKSYDLATLIKADGKRIKEILRIVNGVQAPFYQ